MSTLGMAQYAHAMPETGEHGEPLCSPEVEQVVAADQELVLLMNRYERPLYNYLLTILQDQDIALDCAQEAFVRAYEHLRKGKSINRNWLFTVGRNRAMDEFRRRKRFEPEGEALEQAPVAQSFEGMIDLQNVLERLSPVDREVLYLYSIAGFKTEEVGTMLGIRGTAVRQRLYRARERLRQLHDLAIED